MRMPLPVEPSLLLIFITIFVLSWGDSCHGDVWSVGDGVEWKYDVETVVGEMAMSSSIIPT